MTLREAERTIGVSLDGVREWLGSAVVEAVPIATLRPLRSQRHAYRIRTGDGRTFKLRGLRYDGQGALVARILTELADEGFPPVVFHAGLVTLEPWIEGTPLPDPPGAAVFANAGARLGRIHARRTLGGEALPEFVPTAADVAELERDVERLRAAGGLDADDAARLIAAARAWDPGESRVGLTHGDYCAENALVTPAGDVRWIDNESVAVGSIDRDVERTRYRWPMSARDRATFFTAYADHAPAPALAPDTDAARFWRARVVVKSARFRVVGRTRRVDVALDALASLLDDARQP